MPGNKTNFLLLIFLRYDSEKKIRHSINLKTNDLKIQTVFIVNFYIGSTFR